MTPKQWPSSPLGSVLTKNEDYVSIDSTARYQQITVRLWGRGVRPRGEVLGVTIGNTPRVRVRAGQFILSKIDARNGALGIVPPQLEGAVASNDFPTFDVDKRMLRPGFLGWLLRTHEFVAACRRASEGTTNRVRLSEDRLLNIHIPLPDIEEQDRILAQLDAVAKRVTEAQCLCHEIGSETDVLLVAMAHRTDLTERQKLDDGWKLVRLADIAEEAGDLVRVSPDHEYPNLGVYSFGRGLFHKPPISGLETSASVLKRVRTGQFIYSRLFAFEGACGLVTDEFDGHFVSNEYPTFICGPDVLPEFLFAYFRASHVWKTLAAGSKGLGSRRQRVQPERLLMHELLVPPMPIQEQIRAVFNRRPEFLDHFRKMAGEVDAMIPAILDRTFAGALS